MDQFVSIARIVKKRGVRGEVAAELLTDFPDRFSLLQRVHICSGGKRYREEIEEHWFHQKRVVLKFRGRNCPEEVQELIGGDVQIPEDERLELPSDCFYHSDLIGCKVLEGEDSLGTVTQIFETGAEGSNLVVANQEGVEIMIPLVRRFVVRVDITGRVIYVDLPPGLASVSSSS